MPSVMLESGSVDEGVLCGSPSACKFVYLPCLHRETYDLNLIYAAKQFFMWSAGSACWLWPGSPMDGKVTLFTPLISCEMSE